MNSTSSCITLSLLQKKRRRTILANRVKRLRYKKNKRAKWSKHLAQLWKDRADAYERDDYERDDRNDTDVGESITSCNESCTKSSNKSADAAATNKSYEIVQKDCELEGMHLLPQVVSPENSSTENISVEKRLMIRTTERDKALKDALYYRSLVEKLETDIKEAKITMHYRVAAVRDFWRNSVLEGRSRSGVILQQALTQGKIN